MNKRKISILINLLIVIFEIIALIVTYNVNHRIAFEYYTEDSNILALIVSSIFLIYLIRNKHIPEWLKVLKYSTTICLTLTFLVVIFILAPMYNFNYAYMLLYNSLLYQHLLCPVLGIITFIFFDDIGNITNKDSIRGLILTFTYAFIFIILNVLKLIEGPYPFLMVYKQSVFISIMWFFIILGLAYLAALILRRLYSRFNINKKRI